MTKPRRPRTLRPDERRLWAEVTRGIAPMGARMPLEPEPEAATASPDIQPPQPIDRPDRFAAAKPAVPRAPPLAPIERKTLLSLRRGTRAVDAVIDLHGMRQAEAHDALLGFLRRAQAAGHNVVLVITGKGGAGSGDSVFEERGVLRRTVPHWLRLPDLRSLVLGFEESSPHHGGSGALYVRLRRRRGAGSSV
jgi:DNA-nicking Smr family endonuclease